VFVFYESIQRLQNPPEVESNLMIIIAVVGLVANLIGILLLRRERHSNLNVKGAFLHIVGDTISSVGVLTAGIIVATTGFELADPIMAIIIGVIILLGAVQLVRESSSILLESVPKSMKIDEVIATIKTIKGVKEIHDFHLWTITSGIYAMSTHVMLDDQKVGNTHEIIDLINSALKSKYNISHTTIQTEFERCDTCNQEVVCQMSRSDHEENKGDRHTHES
jgi:cobalt-zinc-cadmium efflux system protein